jgi:hypothetical protein
MYILEGLYILVEECTEERLNELYMSLDGIFDDIEYIHDLQSFLLYLTTTNDFRIRELLINTGLLCRIFSIKHPSTETQLFMAKMLAYVVCSGSTLLQRHFTSNDLLKEGIRFYRDRRKDAVFSAFSFAFERAKGTIREYMEEYKL